MKKQVVAEDELGWVSSLPCYRGKNGRTLRLALKLSLQKISRALQAQAEDLSRVFL